MPWPTTTGAVLTATWANLQKKTLTKPKRVPWTANTADGFALDLVETMTARTYRRHRLIDPKHPPTSTLSSAWISPPI